MIKYLVYRNCMNGLFLKMVSTPKFVLEDSFNYRNVELILVPDEALFGGRPISHFSRAIEYRRVLSVAVLITAPMNIVASGERFRKE
ncbi:hypothetical protein ACIQZG_07010 [Lysinibacillus sp. NPDC096418]|uniref:hypothetical protein n=1 Tax=Lysinibacillus sp. NPDC096418 TaxID=3364138 RepID=UPI00381600EA